MKAFINQIMGAAGKYTVFDFACLKTALLFLGILIGVYFAEFFVNYTSYLWGIFIVSYVWIMYRTFFKHMN